MFYFKQRTTLLPVEPLSRSPEEAQLFLQVLSALVNGTEETACSGLCCLNIQYSQCLVSAAFVMQNVVFFCLVVNENFYL